MIDFMKEVTIGLLFIAVIVGIYYISNDISRDKMCSIYGEQAEHKVVFINGTCYKYLGNETFEKVVFKGIKQ